MVQQGKAPNNGNKELFGLPNRKHAGKVKGLRSFEVKAITSGPGLMPPSSISPNTSQLGSGQEPEAEFEDDLIEWRTL